MIFPGASDDADATENVNNLVESETEIICCQDGSKLPGELLHPECHPIDIPPNDHFYSRLGQRCMEFARSMPAERPDCNLGPREQVLMTIFYTEIFHGGPENLKKSRQKNS